MRQVMPHRNNIELRRTKCKRNFRAPVEKPVARPKIQVRDQPQLSSKGRLKTRIGGPKQ
jgi:hypothetical protein